MNLLNFSPKAPAMPPPDPSNPDEPVRNREPPNSFRWNFFYRFFFLSRRSRVRGSETPRKDVAKFHYHVHSTANRFTCLTTSEANEGSAAMAARSVARRGDVARSVIVFLFKNMF